MLRIFTTVEMNNSKKVARREALVIPDGDVYAAAVSQQIYRHTGEYELLVPCRIHTVAYNGCLAMIFAPSIYRHYTSGR